MALRVADGRTSRPGRSAVAAAGGAGLVRVARAGDRCEVWVENAFLIEFLDPAQSSRYRASMTPENWKRAFGVEAAP